MGLQSDGKTAHLADMPLDVFSLGGEKKTCALMDARERNPTERSSRT